MQHTTKPNPMKNGNGRKRHEVNPSDYYDYCGLSKSQKKQRNKRSHVAKNN